MLPHFQNRRGSIANPANSTRMHTNTPNNTPSPQGHPVHGFATPSFQQPFQHQHQHQQHKQLSFPSAVAPPSLVMPPAGFPMFHQAPKPMTMAGAGTPIGTATGTTTGTSAETPVGLPFSGPYHRSFSSPMPSHSNASSLTPTPGIPGNTYAMATMRVGNALNSFYAQQQQQTESPWEYSNMGYSYGNGQMYGDSVDLGKGTVNLSTLGLDGLDNINMSAVHNRAENAGRTHGGWGAMLPVYPFTPLEAVSQQGQLASQLQSHTQSHTQPQAMPQVLPHNRDKALLAVSSADSDTQTSQYTEALAHTVANAGVDDYDDENEGHTLKQKQHGHPQFSDKGKLPAHVPTSAQTPTPVMQSLLMDHFKGMSLMDVSTVSSDMDVSAYSLGQSSPIFGPGSSHAHSRSAMNTSAATSTLDLTMNMSTSDSAPDAPTSKTPKPSYSVVPAPPYSTELPPTPLRVFTAAQRNAHASASPILSLTTPTTMASNTTTASATTNDDTNTKTSSKTDTNNEIASNTTASNSPRTALVLHPQPQRPVSTSKARAMASSFWRTNPASTSDRTRTPAYRPMHAVTCAARPPPKALPEPSSEESTALVSTTMAFSDNYRGERTLRNCSAAIDDSQNCSLWITNLPPGVTHRELLGSIRGIGRVYATVINPPNAASGHTTSAAKIVFFERDAAHAFFVWANHTGFWLRGFQARVSWNRIKSCEQPNSRNKSRVLELTGFSDLVNEAFLSEWFARRFKFEVDEVVCIIDTGVWAKIEFRFGSYRCQAEAAKMAIAREFSQYIWEVRFGVDPCSVAEDFVTTIPQRVLTEKGVAEIVSKEDQGQE